LMAKKVGSEPVSFSLFGSTTYSPQLQSHKADPPPDSLTGLSELKGVLPRSLLDRLCTRAEYERCTPAVLLADVVNRQLALSAPWSHDLLSTGHHTFENLSLFNQQWHGDSIAVCVRRPLDTGPFFPILMKHLTNSVSLFYIHSSGDMLTEIKRTISMKIDPKYLPLVDTHVRCIYQDAKFFADLQDTVIFDVLNPEKAIGIFFLRAINEEECYRVAEAQELAHVRLLVKPLIIKAPKNIIAEPSPDDTEVVDQLRIQYAEPLDT